MRRLPAALLLAALAGCAAPPTPPPPRQAPPATATQAPLPAVRHTQAPLPTLPSATGPSLSLPPQPTAPPTARPTTEPTATPRPPVAATRCPARVTEETAAACVDEQIQRDHLYDAWTSRACLRVIVEGSGPEGIDIAVRERHEPPCPGEPSVDPIVDRFRVAPDGELLWLDYRDDTYVAYAYIRSGRAP